MWGMWVVEIWKLNWGFRLWLGMYLIVEIVVFVYNFVVRIFYGFNVFFN